jgi:hypothetical protein
VDRFSEVKEGRRCPRRGEGRSDLAPDVPRLAEAADDQLAAAIADQPYRALERFAEAVGQSIERACLVVEDLASERDRVVIGQGAAPRPSGDRLLSLTCGSFIASGAKQSATRLNWIASSLHSSQ